ncbi:immunoglobulin superfamily member 1-like [Hemitrygon akajei]|uniref:immunoglobulin superfamily member 1-like n=1 Tax=Hemitrygon akajei TaxID=2704970 RepID=UPI003BF9AC9E
MLSLFIILMLVLLAENGRALEEVPTPSITAEPTSATGLQGGVVIFKCNTLIDEDKTVYLFRGSRKIFEFRSISEPVAFFTLRNLTSKSDGTYRCISEIFRPRRRKSRPSNTIRLTVLDTQAPLSILRPSSAVVTEGSNVNMTCTANMQYNCVFYVFRGNRYSPIHLGQRRNNTSISILNVTLGDAGKYTCHCLVEVNGIFVLSTPSHFMELTVIEEVPTPSITAEPTSATGLQGGVVIFKCNTLIDEDKTVYLFRGSRMIFEFRSISEPVAFFTLRNLTSKSDGTYRCISEMFQPRRRKSRPSNTIRLTMLDTQAPLSILRPSSAMVTEGNNVNMTCTANMQYSCVFYVFRGNRYSPIHLGQRRNNTSISILNVTLGDAGKYTCHCLVEVNGIFVLSTPSHFMELTVIESVPKPNITFEPKSGIGFQGGIITVKCEIP